MSRSLNSVHLIGTLGRDAATKYTPAGKPVSNFSIATERNWKDQSGEWKKETDWHNIVLWGNEGVIQHLTKGKQVFVSGRLQTRSYEKAGVKTYATEVVAEDVLLLGGNSQSSGVPTGKPRQELRTAQPVDDDPFSRDMHITDDDLPF